MLIEMFQTVDSIGRVVPVSILGRKLVGGGGLDGVDPAGDGKLALTLQESRVGSDELLRLYEKVC